MRYLIDANCRQEITNDFIQVKLCWLQVKVRTLELVMVLLITLLWFDTQIL